MDPLVLILLIILSVTGLLTPAIRKELDTLDATLAAMGFMSLGVIVYDILYGLLQRFMSLPVEEMTAQLPNYFLAIIMITFFAIVSLSIGALISAIIINLLKEIMSQ